MHTAAALVSMLLKVAVFQPSTKVGRTRDNIKFISQLIDAKVDKSVDLIMLPELALTGYNFASPLHIKSYLEPTASGPSTRFAQKLSRKYECFTLLGYPERAANNATYNSAVFTSPTGEVLHHYRKTHLYETDYKWGCSENPDEPFGAFKFVADTEYYLEKERAQIAEAAKAKGMDNGEISSDRSPPVKGDSDGTPEHAAASSTTEPTSPSTPSSLRLSWDIPSHARIHPKRLPIVTAAVGICMDLNPYKNEAPYYEYELAYSCLRQQVSLLLCPMAFLSTTYLGFPEPIASHPEEALIEYWMLRLPPLTRLVEPVTFIACNKVGRDEGIRYGGTSCAVLFEGQRNQENPHRFLGALTQDQEGVLFMDVEVAEVYGDEEYLKAPIQKKEVKIKVPWKWGAGSR